MTSAEATQHVGSAGLLINHAEQTSQDLTNMISFVRVKGTLQNISGGNIRGHVDDGRIDGFKSFDGGSWNYNLDPGGSTDFVDHTFSCPHDDRGDLTVNFQVSFGHSGDGSIGNNQSQFVQLVCDHIIAPPTRPQNVVDSNQTLTSITLSWDAPHDDGGDAVNNYKVWRYNGTDTTGDPFKYPGSPARTRNLTDLKPGQDYTFVIYAVNNSRNNGGVSDPSVPDEVPAATGMHVRSGGEWVGAAVYVRNAGVWTSAQPFVRRNGLWVPTKN